MAQYTTSTHTHTYRYIVHIIILSLRPHHITYLLSFFQKTYLENTNKKQKNVRSTATATR